MRISVLDRTIRTALVASAALLVAACHHDGSGNDSNNASGSSTDSAASSLDNAANSSELGDNDMDSNIAQDDGANGTTVGSQGGNAPGGGQ